VHFSLLLRVVVGCCTSRVRYRYACLSLRCVSALGRRHPSLSVRMSMESPVTLTSKRLATMTLRSPCAWICCRIFVHGAATQCRILLIPAVALGTGGLTQRTGQIR
jgi:hypothetical protein